LLRLLSPKINFRFYAIQAEGKPVVLLEIGAVFRHPVQFKGMEFIRVGFYKKKLKDFPEKERELWRVFDLTPFEKEVAAENIAAEKVPMFPELAIRELVANAIIHQDFHLTGTGPMVEIFGSRMEITNPGLPLVKTDRIRASYLHACLRYVKRDYMTNTTLRERFGIDEKNSSMVSRIIKDTIEADLIRCHDETAGSRARKYLPKWA
jgi:predicted HTH transcriptional regulator